MSDSEVQQEKPEVTEKKVIGMLTRHYHVLNAPGARPTWCETSTLVVGEDGSIENVVIRDSRRFVCDWPDLQTSCYNRIRFSSCYEFNQTTPKLVTLILLCSRIGTMNKTVKSTTQSTVLDIWSVWCLIHNVAEPMPISGKPIGKDFWLLNWGKTIYPKSNQI